MSRVLPRALLTFSALILAFGGWVHTGAFGRAVAAVAASNLEPFFGSSLKALWLIDSSMLFTLALIFLVIAARPAVGSRAVIGLLALLPAATPRLPGRNPQLCPGGGGKRGRDRGLPGAGGAAMGLGLCYP